MRPKDEFDMADEQYEEKKLKELEEQTVYVFTSADTLNKTNGGEKNGTARKKF